MPQDWICTAKWVQATPSDGAWLWKVFLVIDTNKGIEREKEPELVKVEEGMAFTKLGVYWKVWRVCRKHKLRFRPNVRGNF